MFSCGASTSIPMEETEPVLWVLIPLLKVPSILGGSRAR